MHKETQYEDTIFVHRLSEAFFTHVRTTFYDKLFKTPSITFSISRCETLFEYGFSTIDNKTAVCFIKSRHFVFRDHRTTIKVNNEINIM